MNPHQGARVASPSLVLARGDDSPNSDSSITAQVQPPAAPLTADPTPPSSITRDQSVSVAVLLLMVGGAGSRLLGLVREQLTAGHFGAGDAIAAYTIADNVQTLLFDLVVGGMLQAVIIPILARYAAPDPVSRAELRRISGTLLTIALVLSGVGVALGMLFAPRVVTMMTAAFGSGADRGADVTALTITLVRWLLPAALLLTGATVLSAALYATGRVTAPALTLTLRNAAIVVALIFFADPFGIYGLAAGSLLGAGLMVVALLPALWRARALPRLNLEVRHPAVREAARLALPIAVGLLVSTGAVVVDRNLAWSTGESALGAMRYATTLVQTILGLITAAISLAALTPLARAHAANDQSAFRATLDHAMTMITLLILPATLGMAALAGPIVDLLFRHGATDATAARAITLALLGYLPGTLCAAYDQVLIFAFYARRNTLTPVAVGIFAVGVYLVVAFTLIGSLGMLGLVLANSAQFAAHALLMWRLGRRTFGAFGSPALTRLVLQCGSSALAAALLARLSWWLLATVWPLAPGSSGNGRELALVALSVTVGAVVYVTLLHRWRVAALPALARAIATRFRADGAG